MPAPIKVQLLPHDPRWALAAVAESQVLADALGQTLLTVHHIGSTAIPPSSDHRAHQSLGRYFTFYSTRCPHSALDRQTPDKIYFSPLPLPKAA